MTRHPRPGRRGFTLVELLVALALTILLMAVMATAFGIGMDTLSWLKSVGGLVENLRAAEATIKRDLEAQHLEDVDGTAYRVSHPVLQTQAWGGNRRGYFAIVQRSPLTFFPTPPGPYYEEGADADGIKSFRATDHSIGMTIKLSGRTETEAVFGVDRTVTPPLRLRNAVGGLTDLDTKGNQLVSQWGEVQYFLRPQVGVQTPAVGGNSLQVYTLHRRARVLGPVQVVLPVPPSPTAVTYPDLGTSPTISTAYDPTVPPTAPTGPRYQVNGPESMGVLTGVPGAVAVATPAPPAVIGPPLPTVNVPAFRLGGWYDTLRPNAGFDNADLNQGYPIPSTDAANYGTDVLLNNVLSFRVSVQFEPTATPAPLFDDLPLSMVGPATYRPAGAYRVYDTAMGPPAGGKPRLKAVRIELRVYDAKNAVTRQMTISHDL